MKILTLYTHYLTAALHASYEVTTLIDRQGFYLLRPNHTKITIINNTKPIRPSNPKGVLRVKTNLFPTSTLALK